MSKTVSNNDLQANNNVVPSSTAAAGLQQTSKTPKGATEQQCKITKVNKNVASNNLTSDNLSQQQLLTPKKTKVKRMQKPVTIKTTPLLKDDKDDVLAYVSDKVVTPSKEPAKEIVFSQVVAKNQIFKGASMSSLADSEFEIIGTPQLMTEDKIAKKTIGSSLSAIKGVTSTMNGQQ